MTAMSTSALARRALVAGAAAAPLLAASPPTRARASTLADVPDGPLFSKPLRTSAAWHLARRAAFAPTPAMVAEIERVGASRWIEQQLNPQSISDSTCDQVMSKYFPWEFKTLPWLKAETRDETYRGAPHLETSIAIRHLFTNRVLQESMVEFWSDLLYVSAYGKPESWVVEWNWKVLRTHALGKFSDMLYAALTHPALLTFLDNEWSTKANPNENLGRELLELHTVGVGNYTEADVRQSTLMLTGHSLDWDRMTYRYRPDYHHVGPITVMGFSHPNRSSSDGPAALRAYTDYLASHPATAKRIAQRLAVRFVSDTPSASLVDALASAYLNAKTDIRPVLRALFRHPEFASSQGKKVRRPQEYMAAMVRSANPNPSLVLEDPTWKRDAWYNFAWYMALHEGAGHRPRGWPAVNGYPDGARPWLSANGMLSMWNMAIIVADRWDDKLRVREKTWGLAAGQNVYTAARNLTMRITGYTWDSTSLGLVASWLSGGQGKTVPSKSTTLTKNNVTYCMEAVRFVMASPYMLAR